MFLTLDVAGYERTSALVSAIVSWSLLFSGCYGFHRLFGRVGDVISRVLVWVVFIVPALMYVGVLPVWSFRIFLSTSTGTFTASVWITRSILIALGMIIVYAWLFITAGASLEAIRRSQWNRLWMFVPIANFIIPHIWTRWVDDFLREPEQ